jgi:hypothetical protein
MLHFDDGPVQNTAGVQESLTNFGFKRMERPPCSLDLVSYNFFLFGATKQAFAG